MLFFVLVIAICPGICDGATLRLKKRKLTGGGGSGQSEVGGAAPDLSWWTSKAAITPEWF